MQFPNRFCEDLREHRARRAAYLRHLVQSGFGVEDPEYRPFVGEVFHDRPFVVSNFGGDLVELALINSYALNCVATELRRSKRSIDLQPKDFEVIVRLLGVTDCSLGRIADLGRPSYQQAELSKAEVGRCIEIEVRDDENFDRESTFFFARYRRAEVGDIEWALRKYLGSAADVFALLSPISMNPEEELRAIS